MPVLPNTGVTTPTVGGSSGTWGTENNSAWSNYDNHDHAAGNGKRINSDAIEIDGDVTFASLYAPTNVHRMTFAAITALSSGARAIFVDTDGNLWYRNSAGTNIRITLGSQLDLSATGGIQGDYAAVSAQVAFDDSNDRYTFKQNSATGWARLASGEVRVYETGSSDSVYVGLAAPAALAASYTVTMPLALPGGKRLVQVSSAGALTFENTGIEAATFTGLVTADAGVTCAANQHVTVSGTGEIKHGDLVLSLSGLNCVGTVAANVAHGTDGAISCTAAATFLCAIPLKVGDRLKSVTWAALGDGAVDMTSSIRQVTSGGVITILDGPTADSNIPATWGDFTRNPADTTLTSGNVFFLQVVANAANLSINNIRVTYDRP